MYPWKTLKMLGRSQKHSHSGLAAEHHLIGWAVLLGTSLNSTWKKSSLHYYIIQTSQACSSFLPSIPIHLFIHCLQHSNPRCCLVRPSNSLSWSKNMVVLKHLNTQNENKWNQTQSVQRSSRTVLVLSMLYFNILNFFNRTFGRDKPWGHHRTIFTVRLRIGDFDVLINLEGWHATSSL